MDPRLLGVEKLTVARQGFDEFMNLVIDDAVEVQLPTKENSGKRRQLGGLHVPLLVHTRLILPQAKYYSRVTMFPLFKRSTSV